MEQAPFLVCHPDRSNGICGSPDPKDRYSDFFFPVDFALP
jgi:hypothetical protein